MLKREITYTNYITEEEVTEDFYFNISKTEIAELAAEFEGGLLEVFKRILKTQDPKALLQEFQKFILLAYGQRSEDGTKFLKSDELRAEFKQHAAFDVLFVEMATDTDVAADFFMGVLPKDVREELAANEEALVAQAGFSPPPTPPTVPGPQLV